MNTTTLLDPTAEQTPVQRDPLPRLEMLDGKTIALLDISKLRGDVFLDQLETQLNERGIQTKRYTKPTYARPAPVELQQRIATECDAVIEALAD